MINPKTIGENPFYAIAHQEEKSIIISSKEAKRLKEITSQFLEKNRIIFIVGSHGCGKSLIERQIEDNIPSKYEIRRLVFTTDLVNIIRAIPSDMIMHKKKVVAYIDKFELSEVCSSTKFKKLLELIDETSKAGVCYIIASLPETVTKAFQFSPEIQKRAIVYNVPGLNYEHAKELVVSRLNHVREKKSDSIAPFTEHELKSIWETSRGNPRMILLLCANLYDSKK